MDTIQHAVHGYILSEILAQNLLPSPYGEILFWSNVCAGFLPDVIGFSEKIIKGKRVWNWYHKAHRLNFKNVFVYFPAGLLHLLIDNWLHKKGNRWWIKGENLKWEILGWILSLIIIFLIKR